jgi:hypothetical protein
MPAVQSGGASDEPLYEAPNSDQARPSKAPTKAKKGQVKRLLIVAANPNNTPRLKRGREIREICLSLRGASPARYDVSVLWAATEKDFRRGFLATEPQILHVCGHGTAAGAVLEQEDGDAAMSGEALAQWLKIALAGQTIPLALAVLNFCHSQTMLNSLADIADVVVGPVAEVDDDKAVVFSSSFYMGLVTGCNGASSYHLGCSALEMNAIAGAEADKLYGIRCRRVSAMTLTGASGKARGLRHTLVFFASEPSCYDRLRLDREFRGILGVSPAGVLRIEQRWATRVTDFLQTLLEIRPSIVHISGHGDAGGGFIFEADHDPCGCVAPSQALAKALSLFHEEIRCAVLMFAHSRAVALQLADVLDYVISLSGYVPDSSCILFSEVFYEMIGAGRSFYDAYKAAIASLSGRSEDLSQFSIQGRAVRRYEHTASTVNTAKQNK